MHTIFSLTHSMVYSQSELLVPLGVEGVGLDWGGPDDLGGDYVGERVSMGSLWVGGPASSLETNAETRETAKSLGKWGKLGKRQRV